MAKHLTDSLVKKLPLPDKGYTISFDDAVPGLGVRVTANGARSFVLVYRTKGGRSRTYTIGSADNWQTTAARTEAKRLKQEIDRGGDPMAELKAQRESSTMADLAKRYLEEHAGGKRDKGERDKIDLEKIVLPALGAGTKVVEIGFRDVDRLHRKFTDAGKLVKANRVRSLLSKMFSLAERWEMRPANSNPCRHVARNREEGRERYLKKDELLRLMSVLNVWEDQQAADVFRFLLYTGARKTETLKATWSEFDLDGELPTWTKPSHHTKTQKMHTVALSPDAVALLRRIREGSDSEFVFPGKIADAHRVNVNDQWMAVRKEANIRDVRIHDLRHSCASIAISHGVPLAVVGALLGHTQAQTTLRYAHVADQALANAAKAVGDVVTAASVGRLVQLPKRGA